MPHSAKEQVDITALIRGILNGYPGNSAIFREYLQNSDDAKATKQTFILDERNHPSQSLCDPSLVGSQGPSLLAINNGELADSDWQALRKIHSSSKKSDETQTGKNGLGFRASYHLTENPHVFSRTNLMILDPHHRFSGDLAGGLSIDVAEEGDAYSDQLEPFKAIVQDPTTGYPGTAFRLPLRTQGQAQASQIKQEPTLVHEIRDLLHNFGRYELEEAILFLKHITEIEIRHITSDGTDTLIGSVTITPRPPPSEQGSFTRTTTVICDGAQTQHVWYFQTRAVDRNTASEVLSRRLGYNIGDALAADKLTPVIELATSLQAQPIRGSLYTLLPLPVKTGFPIHVNATFALTPDRQSLKNMEEVGTAESRERRLVEWNRLILNTWTPEIWTSLIEGVSVNERQSLWSLWPSNSQNPYWEGLLPEFLRIILQHKTEVFPTIGHTLQYIHLDDPDVLLVAQEDPLRMETILDLGVRVVQPPPHILSVLSTLQHLRAQVLSPSTLYRVLKDGYLKQTWNEVDPKSLIPLIDYLVFSSSTPTLPFIVGLPWFTTANGAVTAIPNVGSTQLLLPSTQMEATLFAGDGRMLSWDTMDERLRTTLIQSGGFVVGARKLEVNDVIVILRTRPSQDSSSSDFDWVVNFWKWLETQPVKQRKKILSMSEQFHLLPTSRRDLRGLREKVACFNEGDPASVVWQRLGVPTLTDELPDTLLPILSPYLESQQSTSFVPFLLTNASTSIPLRRNEIPIIRQSLYASVVNKRPSLNRIHLQALAALAIFAIRPIKGGESTYGAATGTRVQVAIDDELPLPVQNPPVIYVDVRDRETERLIHLLDGAHLKNLLPVLRIAMANWNLQPRISQELFIKHILSQSRNLTQEDKICLRNLPFVSVHGTSTLVSPNGLIHPTSEIASLYEGEMGRIPKGLFAGDYLLDLQALGFVTSTLDLQVVEERLSHLASEDMIDSKYFQKATAFIKLLDRYWNPAFAEPVSNYRTRPWLPLSTSKRVSPLRSRDGYQDEDSTPLFYDLVLTMIDTVFVSTPSFRSSLGWSGPPAVDLLIGQFRATIALPESKDRYRRLLKLLVYMGSRFDQAPFTRQEIDSIRDAIEQFGRPWIPVVGPSHHTTSCEYIMLLDINLKPPFYQANLDISRPMLRCLGCPERPTLQSLIGEIGQHDAVDVRKVYHLVALLEEIAEYHSISPSQLCVPTQGLRMCPLTQVYYPDSAEIIPAQLADRSPVHSSMSPSLCQKLKISSLSSLILELGEDAFEDDEQMAEDLVTRIKGFLKEYDIMYAFNEFLANADDARATEVRAILDINSTIRPSVGVISTAFRDSISCPTLYLFNNARMSDKDFTGLRRIGKGGKDDQVDTHGRHGLGSLAFYYFSEVVTVISGDKTMILDPSGRYLPSDRGQKRTSLCRSTSHLNIQYPEQLKRYLSRNPNSDTSSYFDGTGGNREMAAYQPHTKLEYEPEATSITTTSQRGSLTDVGTGSLELLTVHSLLEQSYRDLAAHAFFFTSLSSVAAEVIGPQEQSSSIPRDVLWVFNAERDHRSVVHEISYHRLRLILDPEHRQDWLIATSVETKIPEEHSTTAAGLKLTLECFRIQIAIQTSPARHRPDDGWLFSTLRLPRRCSLPFHLNARFAISSNRQSIVLDSPDSQRTRDPKSMFNAWILSCMVPALYLNTLEYLLAQGHSDLSSRRWWLLTSSTDDGISSTVSESFLKILATSDKALFPAVDGSYMCFKDAIFESHEGPAEIASILRVLKAPRFILAYQSLAKSKYATTMTPAFVAETLRSMPASTLGNLCAREVLSTDSLIELLLFLGPQYVTPGLPLLRLSSNEVVPVPGPSDPPLYFSYDTSHATLFSAASFLDTRYHQHRVVVIWSQSSEANVIELQAEHIPHVVEQQITSIASAQDRATFLEQFWSSYKTLPGPPELSAFEESSVKLLSLTSGRLLSLRECDPSSVVYLQSAERSRTYRAALESLGLNVLRHETNKTLKDYLHDKFPQPELNVLRCLASQNITTLGSLDTVARETLASWLSSYLESQSLIWLRLPPSDLQRDYIHRLEIWRAQTKYGTDVKSLQQLRILPSPLTPDTVAPFLRTNIAVALDRATLVSALVAFCRGLNTDMNIPMTISQIFDSIDIPNGGLPRSKIQEYARFFRHLVAAYPSNILLSQQDRLRVVDSAGVVRPLAALYDHNNDLFLSCLSLSPESHFIHTIFREANLHLQNLGLIHQLSLTTFRKCVQILEVAVNHHRRGDIVTPALSLTTLRHSAAIAFRYFTTRLPRIVMRQQSSWSSLDSIRFIRVKDTRRQGASYPSDLFCERQISDFATPEQCVLAQYEPIAWTQRASFYEEPTDDLTALHQTLGVPSAAEVVSHLRILASQVAASHPRNATLLSDLTATYKWLDSHADDAREALLFLERENIFLNVDNPRDDSWSGQWESARNIVLNLSYDWGTFKFVRQFLEQYPNLLRAAGCCGNIRTDVVAETSVAAPPAHGNIAVVFEEMRANGELVDVEFIPKFMMKDCAMVPIVNSGAGNPALRAHRAFLAAAAPHLRGLAGFRQDNHFMFEGSEFGARAVLDFIYTGDFKYQSPSFEAVEPVEELLFELLELLDIANEWDYPALAARIEAHILHKHDLVNFLFVHHAEMLSRARKYRATNLEKALADWAVQNHMLLQNLAV